MNFGGFGMWFGKLGAHGQLATTDLPAALRPTAGYSVARRLHKDQEFAFRALREADDVESDIGFLASGYLDEAALLDFAGSDTIRIKTYYEPFNSWHATQIVKSRMHKIVDNGTLITDNGLPAAAATSASGGYALVTAARGIYKNIAEFYAFVVCRPSEDAITRYLFRARTSVSGSTRFDLTVTSSDRFGSAARRTDADTAHGNFSPNDPVNGILFQGTAFVDFDALTSVVRVQGADSRTQNGVLSAGVSDDTDSDYVVLFDIATGQNTPWIGKVQELFFANFALDYEELERNQIRFFFDVNLGSYSYSSAIADTATAAIDTEGWVYGLTTASAAITDGGNGGAIIKVTNTNEDGPGSLREAIETSGKRTIVFEVGGVIELASPLILSNSECTIAGQTAPEPGITITKRQLIIEADDVRVQHIRSLIGDDGAAKGSGREVDCITTNGGKNIVISHASALWGTDECISISGPRLDGANVTEWRANTSSNVSVEKCLIAEGLFDGPHSNGPHSRGSVIADNVRDAWIFGCAYISQGRRSPAVVKGGASAALVNNWIANPGSAAIVMNLQASEWAGETPEDTISDIIGNVFVRGPNTTMLATIQPEGIGDMEVYAEDNYYPALSFLQNRLTSPAAFNDLMAASVWPELVDTLPATSVISYVYQNAGSRPWARGDVDTRVLVNARAKLGGIIDSQSEVEGYPAPGVVSTRAFVEAEWDLATMAPVGGQAFGAA